MKGSEMEAGEIKTLVSGDAMKEASWPLWTMMKAFRIALLTVLWTGFGMGLGLFCGILWLLAAGAIQHRTPDMSVAYRYISIPAAVCSGSCAFIWNVARAVQAATRKRMK